MCHHSHTVRPIGLAPELDGSGAGWSRWTGANEECSSSSASRKHHRFADSDCVSLFLTNNERRRSLRIRTRSPVLIYVRDDFIGFRLSTVDCRLASLANLLSIAIHLHANRADLTHTHKTLTALRAADPNETAPMTPALGRYKVESTCATRLADSRATSSALDRHTGDKRRWQINDHGDP